MRPAGRWILSESEPDVIVGKRRAEPSSRSLHRVARGPDRTTTSSLDVGELPRPRPCARTALLTSAVLALTGLITGTALVVFFLASVSLPLGLAMTAAVVSASVVMVWRRLDPVERKTYWRRASVGLRAGLAGTLGYDLVRLALVGLLGLKVGPFEAIPLFGQLLAGAQQGSAITVLLGAAYHIMNGAGFGLAYAVVAPGGGGVRTGILWALLLEGVTLAFYPGWLDVRAVGEFASVTLVGHVAYGAIVGWSTRRLLAPPISSARTTGATWG